MVQSGAETVDAYLRELPADRGSILRHLRAAARKELQGFEERMQYGMPFYVGRAGPGVGIASQKQYVALYVGQDVVERFRPRLGKAKVGRGCIRFPHPEQIDLRLVTDMFREIAGSTPRATTD